MKISLTTIIILFYSLLSFSQEHESFFFLETDTTWRKEIFHFPINFAPDIDYEGVEDARFPVGWEKTDSPNFWSYAFAWNINAKTELTEKELELNLQKYFDGLMGVKDKMGKVEGVQNTIALFLKKDHEERNSTYAGKVNTFDAFFHKKLMTLNVLVNQYYCEQKNKYIILFKFSPQDFGNDVWNKLEEVKLPMDFCKRSSSK